MMVFDFVDAVPEHDFRPSHIIFVRRAGNFVIPLEGMEHGDDPLLLVQGEITHKYVGMNITIVTDLSTWSPIRMWYMCDGEKPYSYEISSAQPFHPWLSYIDRAKIVRFLDNLAS